jgi:Peptidase family S41
VIPLIVRFAPAGRSIAVYTENLGSRLHHGLVVLLLNEHSASAAEMVAAFASEYGLATLVGTKTAGRLVAMSAFQGGARVSGRAAGGGLLHVAGHHLEGRGVEPDVAVANLGGSGFAWRGTTSLPRRGIGWCTDTSSRTASASPLGKDQATASSNISGRRPPHLHEVRVHYGVPDLSRTMPTTTKPIPLILARDALSPNSQMLKTNAVTASSASTRA